jgi:hypothetical protein
MFQLIYRDGAPENTGHYEGVDKDTSTEFKVGQAIYLDATGKAKKIPSANANKVYGIVSEPATAADECVNVLKVTPDMIFSCPVRGTAIASLFKGQKLAIDHTDAASVTSATTTLDSAKIGVTVVEKCNASVAGDRINVRFEN